MRRPVEAAAGTCPAPVAVLRAFIRLCHMVVQFFNQVRPCMYKQSHCIVTAIIGVSRIPQPRPAMLYLLSAALHRDYRTYLEDPYTISRCSKYGLKLVCLC